MTTETKTDAEYAMNFEFSPKQLAYEQGVLKRIKEFNIMPVEQAEKEARHVMLWSKQHGLDEFPGAVYGVFHYIARITRDGARFNDPVRDEIAKRLYVNFISTFREEKHDALHDLAHVAAKNVRLLGENYTSMCDALGQDEVVEATPILPDIMGAVLEAQKVQRVAEAQKLHKRVTEAQAPGNPWPVIAVLAIVGFIIGGAMIG